MCSHVTEKAGPGPDPGNPMGYGIRRLAPVARSHSCLQFRSSRMSSACLDLLCYLLFMCDKILRKVFCFGSRFESAVHRGGESMARRAALSWGIRELGAAGAWGSGQETKVDGYLCSIAPLYPFLLV